MSPERIIQNGRGGGWGNNSVFRSVGSNVRSASVRSLVGFWLLSGFTATAADPYPDAITGIWFVEGKKGDAHIEIYRAPDGYAGRIVWLAEPNFPPEHPRAGQPVTDWLNPDENLRDRAMINLEILSDLEYEGAGRWSGGRIYAPDEGKSYRVKATLTDDGTLKLRGFIGISLFGRTAEWTPVERGRSASARKPNEAGVAASSHSSAQRIEQEL